MKKLPLLLGSLALLALTGCGRVIENVNLSDTERTEYENTVTEYQAKIKNWDPVVYAKELAAKKLEAENTGIAPENSAILETDYDFILGEDDEIDPRPPFGLFATLAMAQERLGLLSDAAKTYKKSLRLYDSSEVALNNLGHLYDRMGRYKKAIKSYQKIVDIFGYPRYYIDIANSYIRLGDPDSAQKVYDQYRLATSLTDRAVEQYIYNLRQKRVAE